MFKGLANVTLLSVLSVCFFSTSTVFPQQFSGSVFTTNKTGTVVNQNANGYVVASDVYINGGPQNTAASGLPNGTYYFQVTDASAQHLLSTDNAECRQLVVTVGRVSGVTGPCPHATGTPSLANGSIPVQLAPFSLSSNSGGVYKVWLIRQTNATSISPTNPKIINFNSADAKTDNFRVTSEVISTDDARLGSSVCNPSSALVAQVSGTNVIAYVPKGAWGGGPKNIGVVNIEGSSITPMQIITPNVVNSCASNFLTGQTICTANNTDVYVITGTTLNATLTSAGFGSLSFSGGLCTNCGVAMDPVHSKAVIALSLGGVGGFQYLNLGGLPSFEPPFTSKAPTGSEANISEDILIDPVRNLILSPNENSNYELVNVTTTMSPTFFENLVTPFQVLDSAAEDCSTGIALAATESSHSIYIADLTQATSILGSPAGTWSAPSQVQTLSELSARASGIAVAQGTHTGILSGEFESGGNVVAIALPTTSGTGTPAVSDWVSCSIGVGFLNGFDPHTVTAYKSPNGGDAIGLVSNGSADTLEVIDLTKMLSPTIVPRTVGGHACASGTLPATVLSTIAVP